MKTKLKITHKRETETELAHKIVTQGDKYLGYFMKDHESAKGDFVFVGSLEFTQLLGQGVYFRALNYAEILDTLNSILAGEPTVLTLHFGMKTTYVKQ